jgi:hypothetical protein
MVMQDMPALRPQQPAPLPNADQQQEFNRQLDMMVIQLRNHPSIFSWVIYNEGWGQPNDNSQPALDQSLTDRVRRLDPSRIVNTVSGWWDHGAGDFKDNHNYPHPECGTPTGGNSVSGAHDPSRIGFQGEFGGTGQNVSISNLWNVPNSLSTINQTYVLYGSTNEWNARSLDLLEQLRNQTETGPCSGGVWTQTTDVEGEVNGFLTYDRRILRPEVERWRPRVQVLYEVGARAAGESS